LKKIKLSANILEENDLAANKAYNVGRRGAWRDYIDLFFLLKWKYYSIDKLIKLAELKFSGEFNSKLFLEQLVYFKDLTIATTDFLKESYTDSEIKEFLEKDKISPSLARKVDQKVHWSRSHGKQKK